MTDLPHLSIPVHLMIWLHDRLLGLQALLSILHTEEEAEGSVLQGF